MSIKKVKRKSGEIKWEVSLHTNGRGSKWMRRAFDKKSDADDFVQSFRGQQKSLKDGA